MNLLVKIENLDQDNMQKDNELMECRFEYSEVDKNISDYRLDLAVNALYEFFWNKFCDVYIEDCKKNESTKNLHPMLQEILIFMHPFAPFITEEIHQMLFEKAIIDR